MRESASSRRRLHRGFENASHVWIWGSKGTECRQLRREKAGASSGGAQSPVAWFALAGASSGACRVRLKYKKLKAKQDSS